MKSLVIRLFIFSFFTGFSSSNVFSQAGQQIINQGLGGGLEDLFKGNSQPPIVENKKLEVFPDQSQITPGTFEEFLFFERECKVRNSSACLKSGSIVMSEKPPKEIFDLSLTRRVNKAIQLYERAIDLGNLQAMEAAYDLYHDPISTQRFLNSFTDSVRAKELLEMMILKNYSGGLARRADDYLGNPEYFLSIQKKREGCDILKKIPSDSKMTAATKKIVEDLNSSLICNLVRK